MRVLVVAVVLVVTPSAAWAHPGGTDRFGCHIDHSTGLRHCHGEGGGGGVVPVLAAALVIELGGSWRADDGEEITVFGAVYVQHDGSMLFLVNIGGHIPRRRGVVSYADLGIGMAWLGRTESFLAAQFSIGVKVPLMYLNEADRTPYLKLGAFADLIADGNPAETIGLSVAVGFTL